MHVLSCMRACTRAFVRCWNCLWSASVCAPQLYGVAIFSFSICSGNERTRHLKKVRMSSSSAIYGIFPAWGRCQVAIEISNTSSSTSSSSSRERERERRRERKRERVKERKRDREREREGLQKEETRKKKGETRTHRNEEGERNKN